MGSILSRSSNELLKEELGRTEGITCNRLGEIDGVDDSKLGDGGEGPEIGEDVNLK